MSTEREESLADEQPDVTPDPSSPSGSAPDATPDPVQLATKLSESIAALTAQVAEARRLAEEAKGDARRAQGTADSRSRRLEADLARANAALEELVTRDMDPADRERYQMRRELEQLKQNGQPSSGSAQPDPAEVQEFRTWLSPILTEKGIQPNDPALLAAFEKHTGDSTDPATWRAAAGLAVAEVIELRAAKARTEAEEKARLAREEERAKSRAGTRAAEGRVDRGRPTAPSGQKDPRTMSDKEFEEFERMKDASVGRVTPR